MCPLAGIRLGEHERDVGEVAHRDPHLVARDRPAVVGLPGSGPEVGGVRAGVGLGQGEAAERLAGAQAGQPLTLLLLGSPRLDRAADERGLDRDDGAGRGVGAADLLDDQRVADVVEPAAAVLLGDRGAQVADLPELRGQLAVEARGAVVVADAGDDLPVGELAGRLRDQPLLVAEGEVHRQARARGRGAARARARVRTPRSPPRSAAPGPPAAPRRRSRRPAAPRARSRRGRPRSRPPAPRAGTRPPRRRARATRRSRVIEARMPVSIAGVRSSPVGRRPEERRGRRLEHDPVRAHEQRLVGPLGLGQAGRLHVGRIGERLDAGEDDVEGW